MLKVVSHPVNRSNRHTRESHRVIKPTTLDGTLRGSKQEEVNGGSRQSQATVPLKKPPKELVIDQPRYRAPTNQFGRAAQHLRWQRGGTTVK